MTRPVTPADKTGGRSDITQRTREEDARAWLAAVVDSSDDAIVSKTLEGVITSWNHAAEKLFGYSAAEAVGQHISLIIPPERRAEEVEVLARLRRGEKVDHFETVRQAKDGHRISISLTVSPVKDAAGTIIGASKVARDIGEQRKAQAELQRAIERLRDSEAALKEADRRKDEFLAMLAHELRNPLAPISNALEILRRAAWGESATPHPVGSAIEMMERQVGHLMRLVDDLLDAGRINSGKIELRKERIELSSFVQHAVEAVRPTYESTTHELTVTLPPTPVYLTVDPTRLAQIVGNLLSNACKFTHEGGHIRLTVETASGRGSATDEAVIRVRDNGIGIAADHLPYIFDMFAQVDASPERSVAGLGIGLTLVRHLVEMHGGAVEAHSPGVGRGSEFVVRLPIAAEDSRAPPPLATTEPTATTAGRILVVDDNRDAADSLAMLLLLSGHETRTAYDGPAAVEAATDFQPDVILLDIGLPEVDGYEVARRIRAQQGDKRAMLVALTGWGLDGDRHRSEEAGFDAHLVKPVDPDILARLLAELTAR